jgi:hypothetical protein
MYFSSLGTLALSYYLRKYQNTTPIRTAPTPSIAIALNDPTSSVRNTWPFTVIRSLRRQHFREPSLGFDKPPFYFFEFAPLLVRLPFQILDVVELRMFVRIGYLGWLVSVFRVTHVSPLQLQSTCGLRVLGSAADIIDSRVRPQRVHDFLRHVLRLCIREVRLFK